MKRFETPALKVEKFDVINIVTTSGDVQPEEKAKATEVAMASLTADDATFTITL